MYQVSGIICTRYMSSSMGLTTRYKAKHYRETERDRVSIKQQARPRAR